MSDEGILIILNQGWRLGIVILCIIIIRAVLRWVTWNGAAYLLWCGVPLCYFYCMGVECFNAFYIKVIVKTSNDPYLFLDEKVCTVIKIVWLVVCSGMLLYLGYSYKKTKDFTKQSRLLRENIYILTRGEVPFTMGVIKPKIFLPAEVPEEFKEPIICHEKVHIARKDYLIKNLAFVLLAINWFQPLMWLAYYLFVKDMEITCDAIALRNRSTEFQKQYAKALFELSTWEKVDKGFVAGYGSLALKERIVNICKNQKRNLIKGRFLAVLCMVCILISFPLYGYIRKPLGVKPNTTASADEVWEVQTRIHP